MTTAALFQELTTTTQASLLYLDEKISPLNEEQKTWKKDPLSWNIVEICAHLNEYATFYHKAFLNKIEHTRFRTPSPTFISSQLGKSAWNSMKLGNASNIKRKFNAQRAYNPTINPYLVSGKDIEKLQDNLNEFLIIIKKSTQINVRKAKIPTAISTLIRLKFGDALLFVTYHNQRHLQQMQNIISHPNFPRS